MTDIKQMLTNCIGEKRAWYPLNQSQIGIYYHCKEHKESVAYNLPSVCEMPKEKVEITRLICAIRMALNNHVAFRCRLSECDGRPGWVLTDRTFDDFDIPVEQVSEEEFLEIKNWYARPFDFEGDTLLRVNIYETELHYYILSDFHHLIYDGTSCSIWYKDIEAAYFQGEVSPEEVTMLDFCAFDEAYASSEAEKEAVEYFRGILGNCDEGEESGSTNLRTTIPADLEASDEMGDGFMVYYLDRAIDFSKVSEICEGRVGAFFIGAFAFAAAKFLGNDSAVVYTGNHGRMDARMSNSAGMFVRMLPVYVRLSEPFVLTDYLAQVQERLYGAIKHGKCSFGTLMKEHNLSIDLSVLYQGDFFNHVPFGDVDCPWEALPLHGMDDDVVVMVFKEQEHFKLKVEYRKDKYKLETVKSFLRAYEDAVKIFIGI